MAYAETVYSILRQFGMEIGSFLSIGTVPVLPIILSSLPLAVTIAAFSVMVVRNYRASRGGSSRIYRGKK
jgi:hypothetical protein